MSFKFTKCSGYRLAVQSTELGSGPPETTPVVERERAWRELTYSVDMADEVENIVLVSETLIHLAAGTI